VQASGKTEDAAAGRRAALLLSEAALSSPDATALAPSVQRRLRSTLARLYEDRGERVKALALYRELLSVEPDVVSARAGAARILEAEGNVADARALWDEVATPEPGRPGWLEAHYESARLSVALGEQARACSVLKKVPPTMLTNTTSETPKKIADLLRSVCAG
jgi:tetratricopeptide (TPR) repeat protein